MPTDAELRTLFHDASAPAGSIDAAAVIRRSKRRRLPQQLGAGSVLTLAVAGIGVAGLNGLRGIAPMGASDTLADAPAGVSESAPHAWTDGTDLGRSITCSTDAVGEAEVQAGLEVAPRFPATAAAGQPVSGALTLTNTGTAPVAGVAAAPTVTMSRGSEVLTVTSAVETAVTLAPGDSVTLDFSFDAVDCDTQDDSTGAPLDPGEYTLTAVLRLVPDDGPARLVGGPASAITLR